jgi:ElaB/YqjD/DUF883 family membrane-anchored ribosome-binding protein
MRRYPALLSSLTLFALTACASPADVAAQHQKVVDDAQRAIDEAQKTLSDENRQFVADAQFANEWNDHWWGIPAGGWVAIFIALAVGVTIALVTSIVLWHERRNLRRRREHELALERERVKREKVNAAKKAIERGGCQVCGAAPIPNEVLKEISDDVETS